MRSVLSLLASVVYLSLLQAIGGDPLMRTRPGACFRNSCGAGLELAAAILGATILLGAVFTFSACAQSRLPMPTPRKALQCERHEGVFKMTLAHGTDRLESARLVLRRIAPDDLPFFTRVHALPEVAQYLYPGGPAALARRVGRMVAGHSRAL